MTLIETVLLIPKTETQLEEYFRKGYDKILIVGTTNKPGAIRKEVTRSGRLGRKIECSLPTTNEERRSLIMNAAVPTISSGNQLRHMRGQTLRSFGDYFGFDYDELLTHCAELEGCSQAEITFGTQGSLEKLLKIKRSHRNAKIEVRDLIADIPNTKVPRT